MITTPSQSAHRHHDLVEPNAVAFFSLTAEEGGGGGGEICRSHDGPSVSHVSAVTQCCSGATIHDIALAVHMLGLRCVACHQSATCTQRGSRSRSELLLVRVVFRVHPRQEKKQRAIKSNQSKLNHHLVGF